MKTGTYTNRANGGPYIRVSAGPCRGKYVHQLVAEAMLGRELLPHESVDHKDSNTLNPRWTNLEVVTLAENTHRRNLRAKA